MNKDKISVIPGGDRYRISYALDVNDVVDAKVYDMSRSGAICQMIPCDMQENGGSRMFEYEISGVKTLPEIMRQEMDKKQMLMIIYNVLDGLEAFGKGMVSLSYVAKDVQHVFVSPENYEVRFVVAPVDKEFTDLNEVRDLIKSIIVDARYSEADTDNYVARLINYANMPGTFSVSDMKNEVAAMLLDIGIRPSELKKGTPVANMTDMPTGNSHILRGGDSPKVNRLGVIRNNARMNGQVPPMPPMGQLNGQVPPMPPMGQMNGQVPPMPPMGQMNGQVPPMGQMNGQVPPMPPMGQMNGQVPPMPPMGRMNGQVPPMPPMPPMGQMNGQVPPMGQMNGQVPPMPPMGQMNGQVPPMGQMNGQVPPMPPMSQMNGQVPPMDQMNGQMPPMPEQDIPERAETEEKEQDKAVTEEPASETPVVEEPVAEEHAVEAAPVPVQEDEALEAVDNGSEEAETVPDAEPAAEEPENIPPVQMGNPFGGRPVPPMPPMGQMNGPQVEAPIPPMGQMNGPQVEAQIPPMGQMNGPQVEAQIPPMGQMNGPQGEAQIPQMSPAGGPAPYFVRTRTGERINLDKAEFKIGHKASKVDYAVVDNPAISKIHCVITKRNGVCFIRDNGSTNGTYINGEELHGGEERFLTNNASVILGNEEFIYHVV